MKRATFSFRTLAWRGSFLELIDQRRLPRRAVYVKCKSFLSVWKAIRNMQVRGAPAIGVAAAFGIYLGAKDFKGAGSAAFLAHFRRLAHKMREARPTGRNLFRALERIEASVLAAPDKSPRALQALVLREAVAIQREDERLCAAIGSYGERLLESGDRVLTQCNAGALATAGIGTALAAVYCAVRKGKKIEVYAPETRPFLQGARLTVWELQKNGVPVTLICDNMAGSLMRAGKVDKVMVGADRIAANGDTANKIGTYPLAELARAHGIPFYVAAPSTTFDFSLSSGREIPIEIRQESEVTDFTKYFVPHGVRIFNPAFDVTPSRLISGIITEKGVHHPPYRRSLAALRKVAQ